MAGSDIIIVDIPSLENAISAFKACSNIIGDCVAGLGLNAAEIQSAWKADASEIYRAKMNVLTQNLSKAQTELEKEIQDLKTKCESSKTAEKKAESIADALESGFMI